MQNDGQYPTRFHIGTQKAGSTYLYNLLSGHPDLTLSARAEVQFFTAYFDKGGEWYAETFPEGENRVDISPGYFKHANSVPKRIHDFYDNSEDLRFTLFLRNPIDYVASHFHMHRMHEHFKKHPESYPEPPQDLMECLGRYPDYFNRGKYARISDGWLSYFDRSQFKIFVFEDFIDNPQEVTGRMLRFWDIPNPDRELLVSETSRNPALPHRFLYKLRGWVARHKAIKNALKGNALVNAVLKMLGTSPSEKLSDKERETLRDVFSEDVKRLREEFDVSTEVWDDFKN